MAALHCNCTAYCMCVTWAWCCDVLCSWSLRRLPSWHRRVPNNTPSTPHIAGRTVTIVAVAVVFRTAAPIGDKSTHNTTTRTTTRTRTCTSTELHAAIFDQIRATAHTAATVDISALTTASTPCCRFAVLTLTSTATSTSAPGGGLRVHRRTVVKRHEGV